MKNSLFTNCAFTQLLCTAAALGTVFFLLHVNIVHSQTVIYTDSHGNKVYDNGTIDFVRPLPVGNGGYKTSAEYEDGGLGILFAFARSFVNTIAPKPFPFDILEGVMQGTFNFSEDYMEVVNYAMGLAICFAIGFLFIILFALCGCCVCFCRMCCGNCGASGEVSFDENEGCKRMGYGQILFMMCAAMFVAGCCVYVTNDTFATTLNFANSTTSNNLDDLDMYFTNTAEEFDYLVSDMYDLVQEAVLYAIDNMGTVAEQGIQSLLNFDDVFNAVDDLDTSVSAISTSLAQVRSDITSFKSAASDLSTTISTLANDIDTTTTGCASDCTPNTCSTLDTNTLRGAAIDTSNMPNLDSVQTAIDSIKSSNLSGIAAAAQSGLDGISGTIDGAVSSVKTTVNSTMNNYAGIISGMTGGVLTSMQSAFPIASTKQTLGGYFETAQDYDIYRQYVGLGLTSAFVGLVALFVVGMCFGFVGDDKKLLPTERGFCSNCGSCIIMIAVMLMFVLGPVLMLLTTVSFTIGGLLEKICQPMLDLTLFSEFVDTGAIPGFSLGALLIGNPNVSLKVYDILLGCRANKAPFEVFKLDSLIPIEDSLNFTKHLSSLDSDLSGISGVDISSYQVLTPALQSAMTDIQNSGLSGINFTDIDNQINQPVTSFNADTVIAAMNTIKSTCSNPTQSNWDGHIATMTTVKNSKIPAVESAITALQASLATLETDVTPVDGKVTTVLTTAQSADDQIQNNMTSVMTEAANSVKGNIMGYLDQFSAEVMYLVYNEVGNCEPLWNLYNSFTVMLCNYGVDTLNGFWFSLGWGLIFFVPTVYVGMTLSGFYKTMDKVKGWPEPEEEHDDEDFDDFQKKQEIINDRKRDEDEESDY